MYLSEQIKRAANTIVADYEAGVQSLDFPLKETHCLLKTLIPKADGIMDNDNLAVLVDACYKCKRGAAYRSMVPESIVSLRNVIGIL